MPATSYEFECPVNINFNFDKGSVEERQKTADEFVQRLKENGFDATVTTDPERTTVTFQKIIKAGSIPGVAEKVNALLARLRATGLEYNIKMNFTNPEALK
jgi:hypothetical protein